jgi:hypothetical protein
VFFKLEEFRQREQEKDGGLLTDISDDFKYDTHGPSKLNGSLDKKSRYELTTTDENETTSVSNESKLTNGHTKNEGKKGGIKGSKSWTSAISLWFTKGSKKETITKSKSYPVEKISNAIEDAENSRAALDNGVHVTGFRRLDHADDMFCQDNYTFKSKLNEINLGKIKKMLPTLKKRCYI